MSRENWSKHIKRTNIGCGLATSICICREDEFLKILFYHLCQLMLDCSMNYLVLQSHLKYYFSVHHLDFDLFPTGIIFFASPLHNDGFAPYHTVKSSGRSLISFRRFPSMRIFKSSMADSSFVSLTASTSS